MENVRRVAVVAAAGAVIAWVAFSVMVLHRYEYAQSRVGFIRIDRLNDSEIEFHVPGKGWISHSQALADPEIFPPTEAGD